MCTDFAHVVRILCTYTAYLLRNLCGFAYIYGFCARWSAFAYVYSLYFSHLVRIFHTYMAYLHGVQMRTVSRNPIFQVPRLFLSVGKLVICGQYQGSDLEGSVKTIVCTSCSLLLDSLKDPVLRVPLISFSARAARDSPSDLTWEVSC